MKDSPKSDNPYYVPETLGGGNTKALYWSRLIIENRVFETDIYERNSITVHGQEDIDLVLEIFKSNRRVPMSQEGHSRIVVFTQILEQWSFDSKNHMKIGIFEVSG